MEKIILTIGALALLGSVLLVNNQPIQDVANYKASFETFKARFNKKYGSTEEAYRLSVYAQNMIFAQEFNAKKGKNVFGETMFFDLTDQEFAEIYLTLRVDESELALERITSPLNPNVDNVDWTTKGAVTNVKDQGQCGSCWTFGTTGVLEGHFFLQTGELPNLSEQQLVDCSTWADLNFGCNGGMPSRALNYVKRNGITTQDAYPYTAVQGTCTIKGGAYKANGHVALDTTEEALIAQLQIQPVSVTVDATNWKYYDPATEEIFSDCETTLNHAVLAVGYSGDYLKIKNSWSTAWGKAGFIHLKRGANTCGVWNNNVVPK